MDRLEIIEIVNAVSFLRNAFVELEALFLAVKKETEEHTQAHTLACIGQYLSADWGGGMDAYREKLEAMRRAHDGHQQ